MKITFIPKQQTSAGYALIITLVFLAIALMAFGSIMNWAASNALLTKRNNLYVSARAAAESDTENVITTMMRDFTYGALNPVSSYDSLIPDTNGWPMRFTFSDTNGVANQTSVDIGALSWTKLPSQFRGLYGYGQNCVIASTATTTGQRYDVPSTVTQSIWFGTIPVFQFAIFYNMDLEINPGAPMNINGRVHSNGNLWATGSSSSSPLTFSTNVDAAGMVSSTPSPLDNNNYGNRSGNVIYDDPNSPVQNSDTLTMPIGTSTNNNPTNVEAILNLPPDDIRAPLAAAYSTNGQVYLFNEADLIVSNSASGINGDSSTNVLTVFYQNPNRVVALTPVAPDVMDVSTQKVKVSKNNYIYTYTTNYYYSYVTNVTFYDYRESKTVQAVQVDVGSLDVWLTNTSASGGSQYEQFNTFGSTSKGHGINSIYVYSGVSMSKSTLPGVRLADGSQLPPNGLTVATALPLYVMGNYNVTADGIHYSESLGNTTYTVPAAILGDSVTILSSNWKDSYNSGTSLNSRTATSTIINAATLEGIVPSNGSSYSGGVENFLRLLEGWSGHALTYNGSIVVMFPSQYATNTWSYGSYYTAPIRQWGFDLNFTKQDKLPPLTPQIKATVRGDYATE